jgi:hypothetical protein
MEETPVNASIRLRDGVWIEGGGACRMGGGESGTNELKEAERITKELNRSVALEVDQNGGGTERAVQR